MIHIVANDTANQLPEWIIFLKLKKLQILLKMNDKCFAIETVVGHFESCMLYFSQEFLKSLKIYNSKYYLYNG